MYDTHYYEPTVTIEEIDSADDDTTRLELITKRTAEENYQTNGYAYVIYPHNFAKTDPSRVFNQMLANLAWEFYHPNDPGEIVPMKFALPEINYRRELESAGELELIGRLDVMANIIKIARHDASFDVHKAINRTGCFKLTLETISVSHTNLEKSPTEPSLDYHASLYIKPGSTFDVVWNPRHIAGRVIFPSCTCYVPLPFVPNDGFPTLDMVKTLHQAQHAIKLD